MARTRPKAKAAKRHRFPSEYKLEVVRLTLDGTKSVATVAAELGIDPYQLYRWRRAFEPEGAAAFPVTGR